MEQGEARRRARELGGIAVSARKGSTGKWTVGGWPSEKDVWIVISPGRSVVGGGPMVLDDGENKEESE
jgi:hypothetical protein